jgi:3-hydroxyacyl-CoA dehydrogenase/enoyl-CoA hydratase/3-hydroxybutyryl-CoA epimerase
MERGAALTHRVDGDGILRIVFDSPGERTNLLSSRLLADLNRLLDDARRREEIRALLFSSARPRIFLAGLDIEEIAALTDAYQAAEAARFGQSVLEKIATLGLPSACAIEGTCLGGGLELALACTYRLAAPGPAVRLGLPEVQLGIIPGFGGTQRLPRRIGLVPALELILTGRRLGAEEARRAGLVDLLVPAEYLEREALALLRRALEQGEAAVTASLGRGRPLIRTALERIGPWRRLVADQARKRAARRLSPEDYPAPFRAIEAVEAALGQPPAQGLDAEARLLGELIPTPTSKNLVWLFQNRTALKSDVGGARAAPRRVRRLAVIGAGVMGGGVARLAADRGIPVRLRDLRYEQILNALRPPREPGPGSRRDGGSVPRRRAVLIAPTLDETGLSGVDLVFEAVNEDLGCKREVLARAERRVGEEAVFATGSSALPVSEIAARALRPERVVGLHFFNPVERVPLVEIVAGRHSSPAAVATAHAFVRRLGKVPVLVADSPGFLVNRIVSVWFNEAIRLLSEGVRLDALDRCMLSFGMPAGPFALLDQAGLDSASRLAAAQHAALGKRAAEAGSLLEAMVAEGRLGRRTGRGFYRYRNGKPTVPDRTVYDLAGGPAPREVPAETLQERMVLAMVNEAALCLEENVVRAPRSVDVAMVLGAGFPAFRGGLLRHADAVGIPLVVDRLQRLSDAHGERFRPAESLQKMVRRQARFYG